MANKRHVVQTPEHVHDHGQAEEMVNYVGDENEERGNWRHQAEFTLSCIGYTVGLGNIWRFPIKCYKWGGGNFLILYWIMVLFIGIPIILLEQSLGQFTSRGPTHCWRFARVFQGIGFAMCAISFITGIYYTTIIGWSFYYLFASFQSVLPWAECQQENSNIWWTSWHCLSIDYDPEVCCLHPPNTPASDRYLLMGNDGLCYNRTHLSKVDGLADHFLNPLIPADKSWKLDSMTRLCGGRNVSHTEIYMVDTFLKQWYTVTEQFGNTSYARLSMYTFDLHRVKGFFKMDIAAKAGYNKQFSSTAYFRKMLGKEGDGDAYGLDNIGTPKWDTVLCLLLSWIIVYVCVYNGIKSVGRVVWFTALAPYIILLILLIRAVTVDGSYTGIMFFLSPDWDKFSDFRMWSDCVTQLFFSLSASWGGMMALSSYNRFHNNVVRDSVIVVLVDSLTSLASGFVIFGMLGHLAAIAGRDVDAVAKPNVGLAFEVYPMALAFLSGGVFWSILFALLLILLGLDTQIVIIETVFTVMHDYLPHVRSSKKFRAIFFGLVCFVGFLLGLVYTCPGGDDFIEWIDKFSSGWALLVIGILETIAIGWIYGHARFGAHIDFMTGGYFPRWLQHLMGVFWCVVTPGLLIVILFVGWIEWQPVGVLWADVVGWFVTAFCVGWIPAVAVWHLGISPNSRRFDMMSRFRRAFSPATDWGPFLVRFRREVHESHDDRVVILGRNSKSTDITLQ